jgi:crotonobetainyl-CoA:carnitine CoA-transferase CaiB-like acyl-CoA transferase
MRPLEGVRVLDLSRVMAGPFCTLSLGDLGADVVKVEDPDKGDDTRAFGPPFVDGVSTYFLSINRNKRSLAVDLKHPMGLEVVLSLARRADVVVENFRPGVADRLGLGSPVLRAQNPRLVYCSISGYGHRGDPDYVKLPGYDAVMQGQSGLSHLTGEPDRPPMRVGVPIADLLTGMTALQAILLALYTRERTGHGQHLDIAMLDATVQVLTHQATAHLVADGSPGRLGNRHASIAPYETFRAQDTYFNLAVGTDGQFLRLCELLGQPALAQDPRFLRNAGRVEHRAALVEVLAPLFARSPASAWIAACAQEGIPAGPIADVGQALAHPQLAARGMVWQAEHPRLGPIRSVGSPLVCAPDAVRPPPELGEHTQELLAELGHSPELIAALFAAGAVTGPSPG